MNWKHGTLLAVLLGLAGTGGATAADVGIGIQINRSPAYPPPRRPIPIVVPPGFPPVNPSPAYPPGVVEPPGGIIVHPIRSHDLERHVEWTIRRRLGHCVRDVDVDVDPRRFRVTIDAEVRHPEDAVRLKHLIHSLPELAGYQIRFDLEVED
jgi:NADPH-dependent 2,4-dienoyl-CoA reductase/sulfur reductase-like enzyme